MTVIESHILRTLANGPMFAAHVAPLIGLPVMQTQDVLDGLRQQKLTKFSSRGPAAWFGWQLTAAGRAAIG